MKKLLSLFLCLSSFCILNAQDFLSTEFPGQKIKVITCSTEDGSDIIRLSYAYTRDRINKKKLKFIKINGKKYQIELKKKGIKEVFDDRGQLIATVSKGGKTITHIIEEKKYFLAECTNRIMSFHNKYGEEQVVLIYEEGISDVLVNHVNTRANQLLTALCFNELVEKKIREQKLMKGFDAALYFILPYIN